MDHLLSTGCAENEEVPVGSRPLRIAIPLAWRKDGGCRRPVVGAIEQFGTCFHGAVGHVEAMVHQAARTGRHWIQGVPLCRDVLT